MTSDLVDYAAVGRPKTVYTHSFSDAVIHSNVDGDDMSIELQDIPVQILRDLIDGPSADSSLDDDIPSTAQLVAQTFRKKLSVVPPAVRVQGSMSDAVAGEHPPQW